MSLGQDGSGWGIYAQRFNASGAAVGSETRVNTSVSEDQIAPSVTALVDGGYVVTWTYAPQFTMGAIYGQVFDDSGARAGGEVRVNSHGSVSTSSVAALADGTFVVSWTTQSGVFARQFWPAASTQADSGNNILFGTSDPETMDGGSGDDRISGFSGNDVLTGGTGSDSLFGGNGNDILSADRHIGFDGRSDVDHIFGEAGNDVIFAGYGDIVDGGEGFDTLNLSYQASPHGITGDTAVLFKGQPLSPGAGTVQNVERFDAIALTPFNDTMVIGDQADPATAYGWDGEDHLIGQEHNVTLYGGNGNDLLVGSTASDHIYGEAGNDTLIGYLGIDHLWGGTGADRFIITHLDVLDRIYDFEHGVDNVDLSDIDADVNTPGDQAFTFIGFNNFTGAAGELRYWLTNSSTYVVEGDVNGDGIADLIIDMGLPSALTQSDFLL
jgi:Ca2+-binding RTX toxin-like protein